MARNSKALVAKSGILSSPLLEQSLPEVTCNLVVELLSRMTTHQNIFQSVNLSSLETKDGRSLPTYKHCLAQIICNPPLPMCYLGECALKETLIGIIF